MRTGFAQRPVRAPARAAGRFVATPVKPANGHFGRAATTTAPKGRELAIVGGAAVLGGVGLVLIARGQSATKPPGSDPCAGVTCPAGQHCVGGQCVAGSDPCLGVTCPTGQTCQNGVCVGAGGCAGGCGACEQCLNGVCSSRCAAGQQCVNNQCVAPGGGCGAGCGACQSCVNNQCVSLCAANQACINGQCSLICTSPCTGGRTCFDGTCICPPGSHWDGSSCVTGTPPPTLNPPTNIALAGVTDTTADIDWTATGDSNWYDIQGTGGISATGVAGTSVTISGLTGATFYTIQIRGRDTLGAISAWSQPFTFKTSGAGGGPPPPFTAPTGLAVSVDPTGRFHDFSCNPVTDAVAYEWVIDSTTGDGTSGTGFTTYGTPFLRAPDIALGVGTHSVIVAAIDPSSGTIGPYSAPVTFSVGAAAGTTTTPTTVFIPGFRR